MTDEMMTAVRQLVDRQQICDLIHEYCQNIDTNQPELMQEVFTADCIVDYGEGIAYANGLPALVEVIRSANAQMTGHSHNVASTRIRFDGRERATGETYFFAYMAFNSGRGDTYEWGQYLDVFVRTSEGWRISERRVRRFAHVGTAMSGNLGLDR